MGANDLALIGNEESLFTSQAARDIHPRQRVLAGHPGSLERDGRLVFGGDAQQRQLSLARGCERAAGGAGGLSSMAARAVQSTA